ncbi:Uncharacterised protein [Photobacterium damselae]|nr:Uncharacterised protein [Photobacterium damselae]
MNKKLITLALSGILYVSPTFALTQTQSAIQSTADYAQVVSKRQVVDQLLEQAVTAFKSPARISHAGFTAKMPSNMEIVTDRLLQAYQLEPYRTDLLISAANAQIYNKMSIVPLNCLNKYSLLRLMMSTLMLTLLCGSTLKVIIKQPINT